MTTSCESASPLAHGERRVLERKTGNLPAPNLAPTGKRLFSNRS
jgi:hypothetical protein